MTGVDTAALIERLRACSVGDDSRGWRNLVGEAADALDTLAALEAERDHAQKLVRDYEALTLSQAEEIDAAERRLEQAEQARDEAREILAGAAADLMAISSNPKVNEPYPDDPRWSPWSRFGARALARVGEARAALAARPAPAEAET